MVLHRRSKGIKFSGKQNVAATSGELNDCMPNSEQKRKAVFS